MQTFVARDLQIGNADKGLSLSILMTLSLSQVRRVACLQGKGAGKAQQRQVAAAAAAADLVAAREDAEFQQKASLEVQDVPNTIPAFKCAPQAAPPESTCLQVQ